MTSFNRKRILIKCLSFALIAGCTTASPEMPTPEPTSVPIPPTNTPEQPSSEEAKWDYLELSFDGESCTYEGPTSFKGGPVTQQFYNTEGTAPVTLKFYNNSEGMAAVNLIRPKGEETIQDMIDYFGEEPSTLHAPYWTNSVAGVYGGTNAGESRIWEGELEPGLYSMVCVRFTPFGVWVGTGLEVVD